MTGKPPGIDAARRKDRFREQAQHLASTGTLYLVFIQVASRALTFLGNQFLLRYLSPTILGLAVQLELVSVTVLYTSRESLRVVLQRQPKLPESASPTSEPTTSRNEARTLSQQAVNLAYLGLLIGLSVSYLFGYGYLRQSSQEVLQSVDFRLAFSLYAIATFIELLSEPAFVIVQQHSLYKIRARAETGAAISRCLSACLTAIVMHSRQTPSSVLPFAVGQLAYAATLLIMYLAAVRPVTTAIHFSLLPRRIPEAQTPSSSTYWLGLFSAPLVTLITTFYAQSVFKLLLTQGDSFILSLTADLKSQGAFALASNYGGLLSRLLFQPIEESSRTVFGSLLASNTDSQKTTAPSVSANQASGRSEQDPRHKLVDNDQPVNPLSATNSIMPAQHPSIALSDLPPSSLSQDLPATACDPNVSSSQYPSQPLGPLPSSSPKLANTARALAHLTTTLHLYTVFALPMITLLPHILPALIATLTGPRWSNQTTTRLLAAYAYYLPFLAVNGVLDAFATSVATPSQLRNQSVVMFGITVTYGILAWLLMRGNGDQAVNLISDLGNAGKVKHDGRTDYASAAITGAGLGPTGLVYANVANMAMRIAYSVWFIRSWIISHASSSSSPSSSTRKTTTESMKTGTEIWRKSWRSSLPNLVCVVTAGVVAVALQTSIRPAMKATVSTPTVSLVEKSFLGIKTLDVKDIGYLVAGGLVLLTSIITFEGSFLLSTILPVLPQRVRSIISPYVSS